MKTEKWPKGALLAVPASCWLGIFFLVPLILVLSLSFYGFSPTEGVKPGIKFDNYIKLFTDTYYIGIFVRTFRISILVTILTLILGYPEAYFLTRLRGRMKALVMMIVLSPLLISAVTRTFGWFILLGNNGVINNTIVALGLSDGPLKLIYSETGIVIGLTHVLVPLMVLSIYASLQKRDPALVKAAESLGATPARAFFEVTLPLSLPGILAGSVLVFTMSMSAFVTPAVLGGSRVRVVAYLVYEEFLQSLNWPFGAALSLVLVALTMAIVLVYNRLIERGRWKEVFR
jgi:putative spermidine/putrescine transport system permease protein